MGPAYHGEFICVIELLGYILSEGVSGASGGYAPAASLVRI